MLSDDEDELLKENSLLTPINETKPQAEELFEKNKKSDLFYKKRISNLATENELLASNCFNFLIKENYSECCAKTLFYYHLKKEGEKESYIIIVSEKIDYTFRLSARAIYETLPLQDKTTLFLELLIVLYHAKSLFYIHHGDIGNYKNILIRESKEEQTRYYVCGTIQITIKSRYMPFLIDYESCKYGIEHYTYNKNMRDYFKVNDVNELIKMCNQSWNEQEEIQFEKMKVQTKNFEDHDVFDDLLWIISMFNILLNPSNVDL